MYLLLHLLLYLSLLQAQTMYMQKNSEIKDNWNVTITNDAKEINDTHKIKFEVQKNKNVVLGKIEKVLLELILNGNDVEDTEIGINTASIEIPVKIKVLQHI